MEKNSQTVFRGKQTKPEIDSPVLCDKTILREFFLN